MSIDLEIENHIAVVTINNPPLNVWRTQMSFDLVNVMDSFMENKDVRVVIITGAGDRALSAGADLKAVNNQNPDTTLFPGAFRQARLYIQAMEDCPVPIIGAVNGYALGHGIAVCSGCDILIASETAQFGVPEVRIGLSNGYRMMREVGFPKSLARFAFFSGDFIPAEEAYRLGVVMSVVPPADLMREALAIAAKIAANPPSSVRMFKDTVRWTEAMDLQTGYRFEGERGRLSRVDPEYVKNTQEARAAFFEKRQPQYD